MGHGGEYIQKEGRDLGGPATDGACRKGRMRSISKYLVVPERTARHTTWSKFVVCFEPSVHLSDEQRSKVWKRGRVVGVPAKALEELEERLVKRILSRMAPGEGTSEQAKKGE